MSTIRRKRATAFWSAFSVLLALLLSACGKADFTFPTYSYVNPLGTSFQNADPAVTLDGILDDAIWKDKRLLELAMKTDPGVTVNMTSYYGTDGLYLAFDVRDPSVYSVKGRDITSNSGIELYISSMEGASDISGHGYEVDLSANGETAVKRYERGSYRSWPVQLHTAVKTDGEMNTPNCKGYVIEAFMPYSMFGGEKAASVYATPAIIRSLSADSDEKRQWYNFGMEDRSASWTQASTWWTFDKDGLVAHDVTLIPGDHGTLTGKSCVVDGDDYIVQIVPDDGYYARSVRTAGTWPPICCIKTASRITGRKTSPRTCGWRPILKNCRRTRRFGKGKSPTAPRRWKALRLLRLWAAMPGRSCRGQMAPIRWRRPR